MSYKSGAFYNGSSRLNSSLRGKINGIEVILAENNTSRFISRESKNVCWWQKPLAIAIMWRPISREILQHIQLKHELIRVMYEIY